MSDKVIAVRENNFADVIALRTLNCVVGQIETNAEKVLIAVQSMIEDYKDIEKYVGRIDVAKDDRAMLRKQKDAIKIEAKTIETRWNAPLENFRDKVKQITSLYDTAINSVDELVKSVEAREKEEKREQIQRYFDGKSFDLVPLDKFFSEKWLNKTFKMIDVKKEIDGKIAEVYSNISVLENVAEYGTTAKALYLETLDMGAALRQVETLKANAERLAREKAAREERLRQEQVARNASEERQEERQLAQEERVQSLVDQALDIPTATVQTPTEPEKMEFTLTFSGTKEQLFKLKEFMTKNGISYRKGYVFAGEDEAVVSLGETIT